jgi:hypothetical protein
MQPESFDISRETIAKLAEKHEEISRYLLVYSMGEMSYEDVLITMVIHLARTKERLSNKLR